MRLSFQSSSTKIEILAIYIVQYAHVQSDMHQYRYEGKGIRLSLNYCRFQLTWNIQLGKKNLRLYLDKLYNKPHQGLWSTCYVVVCS
jgi:hypothetical protein